MAILDDSFHDDMIKQDPQFMEQFDNFAALIQKTGDNVEDALLLYSKRIGTQEQTREVLGAHRKAFSLGSAHEDNNLSTDQLRRQLQHEVSEESSAILSREIDSDGEEVLLCTKCALPLGDFAYSMDSCCLRAQGMHAECAAQLLVEDMRDADEMRLKMERKQKQECHDEYGVGWKREHIPRNARPASKLAMHEVPPGMVCLVLDEETNSVGIASTIEPALTVNLDYLSTALQVRRREGHEPVFSLDPLSSDKNSMQEKKFVPEWLVGTAAGEVLFQADYHLKELSMGEYEQPVIGMKSCSDYSDMFSEKNWSAREWFLVRKAEIQLSENNVLIPRVKMGVEAREQALRGDCLKDAQITRQDHPMVKYAEAFTRNFDLIAERKSVIYNLRELAKASTLAKYMLDSDIYLEDSWFDLAEEKDSPCSLEIPQLWNERFLSMVAVKDDRILPDTNNRTIGVYGGVEFGLDKFALTAQAPDQRRAPYKPATLGMPSRLGGFAPTKKEGLARSAFATSVPSLAARAPVAKGMGKGEPGAPSLSAAMPDFAGYSAAISAPAVKPRAPRFAMNFASLGMTPETEEVEPEKPRPRAVLVVPAGADAMRVPAQPPAVPVNLSIARPPSAMSALQPAGGLGISAVAPAAALSMPAMTRPGALATSTMPAGAMATSLALPAGSIGVQQPMMALSATGRQSTFSSRIAHRIPGAAASISAMPGAPRLQGVDLRLDSFDLSSPTRVSSETQLGSWGCDVKTLEECTDIGQAFWSCIDGSRNLFQEEDQALLKEIFHPKLSDRRMEGDCFVPPDASQSYVTKLKDLVKDEHSICQRRKEQFFSKTFVMSDPGPLFPGSWKTSFEIARGETPSHAPDDRSEGMLVPRPEYVGELLSSMLEVAVPIFDKRTEEGTRWRIYRLGSLEVRATQKMGDVDEIGAVFSVRARQGGNESLRRCAPQEKIVKAIQYVERAAGSASQCRQKSNRQYFLVLETEKGHRVVTERIADGSATWEEDPEDLDDRISLAKAVGSRKSKREVLIQDLQQHRITASKLEPASPAHTTSASERKRFVRNAFACATGVAVSNTSAEAASPNGKPKPSTKSLWWMAGPLKS
jgi:hypothetical protein